MTSVIISNRKLFKESKMLEIMSCFNLFFVNNILNSKNITLDLVLTNLVDTILEKGDTPLVPIDVYHPVLNISFQY